VVAPELAVHIGLTGRSPDRAGLKAHLLAVRELAPGSQITVDDLTVAGTDAVAHVTAIQASSARFLGVPLAVTPSFWGSFDALRLERGRVAELWSSLEQAPLLASLSETPLGPSSSTPQGIQLRRLTGAAGIAWSAEMRAQSRLLYLDAGALTLTVDPLSPATAVVHVGRGAPAEGRSVRPGESAVIEAGGTVVLTRGGRYSLRHEPSQPAVLAYEVAEVASPRLRYDGPLQADRTSAADALATPVPALTQELLVDAADVDLPGDALVVSCGRVSLPPDALLALAAANGPLLLAVEAGTLRIEGDDPAREADAPFATRLAAGEATVVPAGHATTLSTAGAEPVTAFVVSVLPGEAVAGSL
jgi:hypothetical protein